MEITLHDINNRLEEIRDAMAERNTIEKAKLGEMRAARWLHPDHTTERGSSAWAMGDSECAKAMQAADTLTAKALGEGDANG